MSHLFIVSDSVSLPICLYSRYSLYIYIYIYIFTRWFLYEQMFEYISIYLSIYLYVCHFVIRISIDYRCVSICVVCLVQYPFSFFLRVFFLWCSDHLVRSVLGSQCRILFVLPSVPL